MCLIFANDNHGIHGYKPSLKHDLKNLSKSNMLGLKHSLEYIYKHIYLSQQT